MHLNSLCCSDSLNPKLISSHRCCWVKFAYTARLIVTRISVVDCISRSKKSLTIRRNISASGGVIVKPGNSNGSCRSHRRQSASLGRPRRARVDHAERVSATAMTYVWPKAFFTVAWGNAPGTSNEKTRLAEGHIHTSRPLPNSQLSWAGPSKSFSRWVLTVYPRARQIHVLRLFQNTAFVSSVPACDMIRLAALR